MTKTEIKSYAGVAKALVRSNQGIKRNELQARLGLDDSAFEAVVGSVKSFVRVRGQGGGFYL